MLNKNLHILVVSGLLLFFCKQDTRGKYIKELQNETLVTTAYERLLELYIDGQLQSLTNGDNWNLPDYTFLQPTNRLIALQAANIAIPQCGGVLASVYYGSLLTNNRWKCSPFDAANWQNLGFDDSSWSNAVEYGSNGNHSDCTEPQFVGNISSNAKWIWMNNLNDFVTYCRGYLPFCENSSPCLNSGTCLMNDVNFCQCSPQFTGTSCETEIFIAPEATEMTTGMRTSEETAHSETTESITTSNQQSTAPQATEETTFHETTQEILVTLEETEMTTRMTTSKETTHSQTTESIASSNPQATEVTTFPQTTQGVCDSTPCQNNGTCLQNNVNMCRCLPQFTGTYCETELMDEALAITAYQQLELMYIDGIEQPLINGNMWNQTDRVGLTKTNRLVAVKVLGDETCGGILASVGDTYFLTNAEWKCSPYNFGNWYILGFDDSQEYWVNAVEFGSNADGHTHCSQLQDVPDISANATWIWVADQTEKTIYCRGYMPVCDSSPCQNNGTCLQNNVKICSCLPQFTGTYCETDQTQRGFGRNNSRK